MGACWAVAMPVARRVVVRRCVWMEVSMTVDDSGWELIGCELGGFEGLRSRGLRCLMH